MFLKFLRKSLFFAAHVVPVTRGASAPGNPPPGPRKRAMQFGKKPEQKQDPDSKRTARRHDHGQQRYQQPRPAHRHHQHSAQSSALHAPRQHQLSATAPAQIDSDTAQPTPRTAPGHPPAPTLDRWTGSA